MQHTKYLKHCNIIYYNEAGAEKNPQKSPPNSAFLPFEVAAHLQTIHHFYARRHLCACRVTSRCADKATNDFLRASWQNLPFHIFFKKKT